MITNGRRKEEKTPDNVDRFPRAVKNITKNIQKKNVILLC